MAERITEQYATWEQVRERLSDLRLAGFHAQATDMGEHIAVIIDGGKRGRELANLPPRRT